MSQEEFDFSVPENIERRLNELEEMKIELVTKLNDVFIETLRLRELQEKVRKLQEETDNTHNDDCTCMECEDK